MNRRWIVLIGVVPVLALAPIAAREAEPVVSRQLAERAAGRLAAAGHDWARVATSGRDLVLSGTAPEPALRSEALALASGVGGLRTVTDRTGLVADQKPYRWSLEMTEARAVLAGFVPNDRARRDLLGAVRAGLPGREVIDRMELGRGAPAGFAAVTALLAGKIGVLTRASVALNDMNISVEGIAETEEIMARIRGALDGVGDGFRLARLALAPPRAVPFLFEIARDGQGMVLSGHVPSEALRRDLVAAAGAAVPGLAVTERLALAAGEPEGFAAAARFLIAEAGRLGLAQASLRDRVLALEGRAGDAGSYRAALDAWRSGLPAGFAGGTLSVIAPVISPYSMRMTLDDRALRLDGHLPDEAARASLVQALRAVRGDLVLDDRTALGLGAPQHFAEAATFALGQLARLAAGRVTITDGAVVISGKARDGIDGAAIAAAAPGLPAGFRLDIGDVTPARPPPQPFVLTLTRRAGSVILDGAAASAEDREAILAAARTALPGLSVEDRIRVAEVRPDGADGASLARFALIQLARLASGTVRIEEGALAVEGEAADRPGYVAVNRALRAPLPGGGRLAALAIAPPKIAPFGWFVEKAASGVVLQGYVPSEALRAALLERANAAFAPLVVRDAQEIAAGAPDGFAAAADAAIDLAARLRQGRASLRDRALALAGAVASEADVEALRAAAAQHLPQGWSSQVTVRAPVPVVAAPPPVPPRPPEPPAPEAAAECQTRIAEVIGQGAITFQLSRDQLRPEGIALVNRIAAVLKQCPGIAFTVEGHTDSDGPPEQNVDLSQRRAQAVVTLLILQGVSASRLQSAGFGASRPVVPNDSAANKARNRRIAFVARP
ncbi:MAG: OmpA family protein [Piscinibacter sp.]